LSGALPKSEKIFSDDEAKVPKDRKDSNSENSDDEYQAS